jgi:hypothetical protein
VRVASTGRFHQLVHYVLGRGLVWITHAEVDDILASRSSLLFEVTDDIEYVRWQALNAPKLIVHDYLTLLGAPAAAPRLKRDETVLSQPHTVNAAWDDKGTIDGILSSIPG